MGIRKLLFASFGFVCAAHCAVAAPPTADARLVDAYLKAFDPSYLPGDLDAWSKALRHTLDKTRDPAMAVPELTRVHALAPDRMIELERLWMRFIVAWVDDEDPKSEPEREAVDRDFVSLLARTGHDPFVTKAAAIASTNIERCKPGTFQALVAGAPDPVLTGWTAQSVVYCNDWFESFAKTAPGKSHAVLVQLALQGDLSVAERLALGDRIADPSFAPGTPPKDRQELRQHFLYEHLTDLWSMGLFEDGLGFWRSLPAADRDALLSRSFPKAAVTVDGLPVEIPGHGSDEAGVNSSADQLHYGLAGSLYLAGDARGARAMMPAGKSDAAQASLDCWDRIVAQGSALARCKKTSSTPAEFLVTALVHPDDDAFGFVEKTFIDSEEYDFRKSGLWALALCKRLGGTPYEPFCEEARGDAAEAIRDRPEYDDKQKSRAFAERMLFAAAPDIGLLVARYQARIDESLKQFGPAVNAERQALPDEGPQPSHFAQAPLPEKYRGAPPAPPAWLKSLAPLPDGYQLVRADRAGKRVAAISVSQNYDPTGEVSAGGYWVHLSNDGGKTWQRPLYTGLADHFPYVVPPASRMPLFDGDTLDLEVAVDEIDLSSITYPPVALRSKRKEGGLYLKIPLAELARDSDGDGLTDIAEEHLLLDPHRADTDGDGIADGSDPMPNVKQAAQTTGVQEALSAFLTQFFSMKTGAIIEPVDRPANGNPIETELKGMRPEIDGADRPIFIEGDPADFAGFRPSKMMLVYSKADITRLRRMTPDFHAMTLGRITLNRARDRGFMTWSLGWTGGTVGLLRTGTGWSVIQLVSWIT